MIQAVDLVKIYKTENSGYQVAALRGCDFHVKKGEFVSVVGPSGAGKTTLLRLLGGIENPSSGQIFLGGESLTNKSAGQLREIRRNQIGFISQSVEQNLVRDLSVRKNLELAMRVCRQPKESMSREIAQLLRVYNLESLRDRKAALLSGGEMLRASVAMAFAKNPKIVLADEPTGKLDSANTITIRKLFREISRESGVAIIVATHDPRFRIEVDRSLTLSDGRLVRIEGEISPTIRPEERSQFIAYIDSTGFIQIPKTIRERLGLEETALLELDPNEPFAVLRPAGRTRSALATGSPSIKTREGVLGANEKFIPSIAKRRPSLAALNKVSKIYGAGKRKVEALRDLDLQISQGEFVAIVGPSGSGKSTLLHILAGLEKPTQGSISLRSQSLNELSDGSRAALRAQEFGLLVEKANLHPSLTVFDNIALPLLLQDRELNKQRALELLEICGLENKLSSYPYQLSEGEKQRVALIAAFIHSPSIVLLDEPTSHLESTLAIRMIDLIVSEAKKSETAMVLATHDLAMLRPGFRMVALDSGRKIADQIVDEQTHKRLIQEFYGIGASGS
ncbi:MAG: ATP-binding cassette domain-containing protein [Candidatus Heimdallarchaeota archaeon]